MSEFQFLSGTRSKYPTESHPLPIYSSKLVDKLESLTEVLDAKKEALKNVEKSAQQLDDQIQQLKQGISKMNGKF